MTAESGNEDTYGNGHVDVFGKDDSLKLNDKEVDELFKVVHEAFQAVLGNRNVPLGPHLAGKAVAEGNLAHDLGRSGDTKNSVETLEDVTEDGNVAGCEDEEES